jgi:N-acetylglucosamine-6-phosphate deacetylase
MRIRGRHYQSGVLTDIVVAEGRIAAIEPAGALPAELGGPDVWLAPAFIDIQVNGFKGHDLNGPTTTAEDVAAVTRALWGAGVGLFCPTITTGPFEQLVRSLRAVAKACEADPQVRHAVAMIHLEGPYISPEDGPRGAHPREHVRPPDWEEFQRLQEAAGGCIGMVTLAPELPGAIPFIERLTTAGVIVALGHHAGTKEHIDAAVAAGARTCTHLGNGAHAMLPRHPNYIWEQLANDALWASFIVDGHHLPPSVVKCMIRAKGLERSILVSDAVWVAGLPPGRYSFMGLDVELTPQRRVQLSGTPYLAGSALELYEGIGKLVQFAGITLAQAIETVTVNPARLLGLADRWGLLAPGRSADLSLFTWDAQRQEVAVVATLAQGDVVYQASQAG